MMCSCSQKRLLYRFLSIFYFVCTLGFIECKTVFGASNIRSMPQARNSVVFSFDKPLLVGPVNYFDNMWVPIPAPSERMYRSHPMPGATPVNPIAFDGDIFYTTNSELLEPIAMPSKNRPVSHFVPFGRDSRYHHG